MYEAHWVDGKVERRVHGAREIEEQEKGGMLDMLDKKDLENNIIEEEIKEKVVLIAEEEEKEEKHEDKKEKEHPPSYDLSRDICSSDE